MKKTRTILGPTLLILFLTTVSSVNVLAAESDAKALYEKNCKMCHAENGKGNEKVKGMAGGDLTKLDLTDKATLDKKDIELMNATNDGVGKMKGFKNKLSAEEVYAIVKYVRSLKK